MPARSVPLRALALSLLAAGSAFTVSAIWPDSLLNQQLIGSVLALIPAFLLSYYRGWARVSVLLGVGMATLTTLHVLAMFLGEPFGTFPLVLVLVAPYVAIALGAGWFGEVRRSAANLRETQLQLIQAEKLESMGRLAAGVAHEVKNPLMTILTGVKVLTRRLPPADASTQALLHDMSDAVGRANTIISGLLSYARQQALTTAPVDLNATIERALLLCKHDLARQHIAVVKTLDASLPYLQLDEFKVEQVLINLFTNAIHAMSGDGTLAVRTSRLRVSNEPRVGFRNSDAHRPGDEVALVEVDDTGHGVPETLLDKVFDPFFTTKPTGVGTGLGLSVSRQIVELHGGTIDLANRPGGGARVTMTFRLGDWGHDDGKAESTAR